MTTNNQAANDSLEIKSVDFATVCPYCQHKHELVTEATDPRNTQKPEPGALNICNECAGVSVFHEDGTLHLFSAEEIAKLAVEDQRQIAHLVAMIKTVNAATTVTQVMPNVPSSTH